ncbi:MAG: protein kinase [Pirellulaceae bacterium]
MDNDESLIESIFFAAVEIDSRSEQLRYLEQACSGDPRLRQRVERLLNARSKVGDFMENSVEHFTQGVNDTLIEEAGDWIDSYHLLQEIGEGGFGVVFLAEQEQPVRRKVALKVVKPGMDTREIIARFEAERQTLALMEHPNIAYVVDAGTTDSGRPYFVMELVNGCPITEYCDKNQASIKERLALFVTVCGGVAHAHQKGIIHRDLKPSNVMVTLHDGHPVPKIIDFGVSKALNQRLTEKTLFTAYGQLVGTPQYMSPEQAEMSGLDIDTRTDVYSLGVLLYELLTGTTPLDQQQLRAAGLVEMQRMIRDEATLRPSARFSTQADKSIVAAKHRGMEPSRLLQLLQGELDWIVMRAIEKERVRRYENVSSLAADIERFLNNEAVHACPPSKAYLLRKFVRRHAGTVIAISAVFLALLVGLVAAGLGLLRANRETTRAQLATQTAIAAFAVADKEKEKAFDASQQLQYQMYVHRLAEARQRIEKRQYGVAAELLDACPEIHRGWEWWHLKQRRRTTIIPTDEQLQDNWVVFCPDGQFVVSTSGGWIAKLHDLSTGKTVREFMHESPLWTIAVSPNGEVLAGGTTVDEEEEGRVVLWSIETGERLSSFKGSPHGNRKKSGCCIETIDFSPDGRFLAYSSHDKSIRIRDISDPSNPTEVKMLLGHDKLIEDLEFSPDGQRIASASHDETVRIWDLKNDDHRTLHGHVHYVTCVTWTPDGKQVISGGWDETIRIWDLESNSHRTLLGHNGHVVQVAISRDGRRLASADLFSAKLWDIENGTELLSMEGKDCVDFSGDGQKLASMDHGQSIVVWEGCPISETKDRLLHTLHGHDRGIMSSTFNPDGSLLATCAMDHTVRLWDTNLGRPVQEPWSANLSLYSVVSFSPDGKYLAAGGRPYSLTVWDLQTNQANQFKDPPVCLIFAPNGLLACPLHGRIRLVDPTTFEVQGKVFGERTDNHASVIWSIAFSSDDNYAATAGLDGTVRIWDVKTRRLLHARADHGGHVWEVAFSPDGSVLGSSGLDGTVRLWDPKTGQLLRTLQSHYDASHGVAFHPSGQYVAAGSGSTRRGRIVIWEMSTGEEVLVLDGHSRKVMDVAFHPGGHQMVSASADGTIKVWDIFDLSQ